MKSLSCILFGLGLFLSLFSGNLDSATFTVLNTNDTGAGSLRWAMSSANTNPGADTINFSIPGAGVHTIFVGSQLPPLSDLSGGTFIDGLTQQGASAGSNPPATATLMVVVDGVNAGAAHGFWILSPDNRIQGLVIINFEQDGIRIQGTPDGTVANYIYCNFIGMNQTGMIAQGNGTNQASLWAGVNILVTPSLVGIAIDNHVDRNLISANYAEGVSISNCPPGDVAFNMVVYNNYIGTDITGTIDMGNSHDGVYIGEGAHDNVVDGNLISGNDFEGICIIGYAEATPPVFTNLNIVFNNTIGLDINLSPLPNTLDGVSIGQYGNWYQGGYAQDNVIDSNTIAHNGNNGVTVWEHFSSNTNADHNLITRNCIYNNAYIGIDLVDDGVTNNDAGDPDTGPNEELNFPVITSAIYNSGSGQTQITGTLDIDTPPNQAQIEVFKARQDPTNFGEGEIYLGSTNPDGVGNWSIIVTGLISGDFVTATTTDVNFNTSEFSQNLVVQPGGVEENISTKYVFYELKQNYPNPFTTKTEIRIQVPEITKMENKNFPVTQFPISLCIYDASGRMVKNFPISNFEFPVSKVTWDGKGENGIKVSPGIYFYSLEIGKFTATRKMVLVE